MIKELLSNKTIHSERLELKSLCLDNDVFIFELLNSEGWKQFIGERNIQTREDAQNYILKIQNLPETIYWTVYLKENKTPIGVITLMKRSNFEFYDLGFAFLEKFSGKGYAIEAASEIVKLIKLETNLDSLIGITLPKNKKSIQLLERLQMKFESETTENKEILHVYTLDL
jgi:[ribosomal protein S5]-alanine N-acetyltransferase